MRSAACHSGAVRDRGCGGGGGAGLTLVVKFTTTCFCSFGRNFKDRASARDKCLCKVLRGKNSTPGTSL